MPKQLERPMSFEEVRTFLHRGSTWLYTRLQNGEILGSKLGGKWIVYPSNLQRYLDRLPNNRKRIQR
ncbi:MAG: hypothetical protein PHT79_06650 [Syntrophomonadaceae bacterium]|nr:hypothetical protein [Syntrophomonadaceae bacterium]MDD3897954.1 hypothetical protein [Syntrophomonadaceae bacterium]MDD4549423.1 hypothetical protein [Syntrophomonadaceae bacterium]